MKPLTILFACLMLLPAICPANPVPAIYISEFSTDEDWIEAC